MIRRTQMLWFFACLVILLIALASWYLSRTEPLAIVYVGRYETPGFDELQERLIKDLVDSYNHDHPGGVRLSFEKHNAKTITEPKALSRIYLDIARRNDVLAVVDNCWGSEIKSAQLAIETVHAPILFLNGDRNGIDFGTAIGARLFLGDAEVVKDQIVPLLKRLLNPNPPSTAPTPYLDPNPVGPAKAKQLVFLGEHDYQLTSSFLESLRESGFQPKVIELSGSSASLAQPEVERVKQELMEAVGNVGPNVSKVIILNCHDAWGTALLDWIDRNLENVTVVGYESVSSHGFSAYFKNPTKHNKAIILGQSPRSVPDLLVALYQKQEQRHPAFYGQHNDLFFVRRCFVAIDLITRALIEATQRSRLSSEGTVEVMATAHNGVRDPIAEQVNETLKKYGNGKELRSVKSSLGILKFANGLEQGSNHIVLYENGAVLSYPEQLNSENVLVPNIQFGFRDMKISDVNISTKTFHADFYFWVRCEEDPVRSLFPSPQPDITGAITKLFEFSDHASEGFQIGVVSTQEFGTIKQIIFHISGSFYGHFNGTMYPFDQQKISVETRVSIPDDKVRITPDQYEMNPAETEADIDGWRILDNRMTVNSRMADEILIPLEDLADRMEQQYSQARLSYTVRRKFWSPALLVFCPLALMTLASLAVLFINNEEIPSGKSETTEQQNELTLLCTLAVVTYLIAYATLAPRLAQPTLADGLVGFTLAIGVANFVFCSAINSRKSWRYWKILTLQRYRLCAAALSALVFGAWLAVTFAF